MKIFWPQSLALILAGLLTLSACGGSDDDSPPADIVPPEPSAVQGLWNGSTASGRAVSGVVLSDGTYYLMYSPSGTPRVVAGVLQGSVNAGATRWSSPNARDFNLEGSGVQSIAVEGSFITGASVEGTITYATGLVTSFRALYDPVYSLVPTLDEVAGTYTGAVTLLLGSKSSTVTVSISGAVTGVVAGCPITGAVQPRQDGNAYTVSITLNSASTCSQRSQSFTGIAYLDATKRLLYVVAPNLQRTTGLLFVGVKPGV